MVNVEKRDLLPNHLAGPDCVPGSGAARVSGCWKAVQGWQWVLHKEMLIPAIIMPFAIPLCNAQLGVLQLA